MFKAKITADEKEEHLLDLMNPPGVFVGGVRKVSTPQQPKMSARLAPQFSGRQNIRDMFKRTQSRTSISPEKTMPNPEANPTKPDLITRIEPIKEASDEQKLTSQHETLQIPDLGSPIKLQPSHVRKSSEKFYATANADAHANHDDEPPSKRQKTSSPKIKLTPEKSSSAKFSTAKALSTQQKSLKSFFTPRFSPGQKPDREASLQKTEEEEIEQALKASLEDMGSIGAGLDDSPRKSQAAEIDTSFEKSQISEIDALPHKSQDTEVDEEAFIDPFASRDSWSKLFSKPAVPLCDGHREPCKQMQTRKPGINLGRSFWMCARYVELFFLSLDRPASLNHNSYRSSEL